MHHASGPSSARPRPGSRRPPADPIANAPTDEFEVRAASPDHPATPTDAGPTDEFEVPGPPDRSAAPSAGPPDRSAASTAAGAPDQAGMPAAGPADRLAKRAGSADGAADPESRPVVRPRRWWRGLTGAIAAGMGMLFAAEVVIQVYALFVDSPGPGPASLIGHFIAAAAVVVAQYFADKLIGRRAALCGIAVVVLTLATLWFFWWA